MGRESFEIEKTAMELVMNDNVTKKRQLAKKIFDVAYEEGVYPSSIHEFYMARGRGEFSGFTVPAINLRSMTYDLARAIFRVAEKTGISITQISKWIIEANKLKNEQLNSLHAQEIEVNAHKISL
jgi:hypothetical protein